MNTLVRWFGLIAFVGIFGSFTILPLFLLWEDVVKPIEGWAGKIGITCILLCSLMFIAIPELRLPIIAAVFLIFVAVGLWYFLTDAIRKDAEETKPHRKSK